MAIRPSGKGAISSYLLSSLVGAALAVPATVNAASSGRQIEEVVVTAERQEASVQDTSISITAFTSEMLEDFGIQDQTDLQNFIPATIILPYDASVRGVGRNFRSLGGDPGVSTYINGVYSEDLYTATIASFWDLERIEILRGPQGTLYCRNAVGGAMNFIANRPTQDFDYKFKAVAGNYNAREIYGMVNGGLIDDMLSGRFVFHTRDRDGYIEEKGVGDDLDSRGEENYAVQLNFTPTDDIEMNVRANRVNVYRVMGGADGGGLTVFRGESADGLSRDIANTHLGYRAVDPTQTNPLASSYLNSTQPVVTFTNPATGAQVQAQQVRSGIDENSSILPNYAFAPPGFAPTSNACTLDKDDIDSDVCATTNGGNFERFHQQGVQFDTNWDVNEDLSIKYIYGYNKLSYERITDDDLTANTYWDRQFYVNHEARYESHELQAFYDINDTMSITSGIFVYDATIDQRGDFFDANHAAGRSLYVTGAAGANDIIGANANDIIGPIFLPQIDLYTAKNAWTAANGDATTGPTTFVRLGLLAPDTGGIQVKHGIDTPGTDLLYSTKTRRDSYAAYTQGVWDINEDFTLTVGLRYAKDDLVGQESLYRSTTFCNTLGACDTGAILGGLAAAGQPLPYLIDPRSPFYDANQAAAGFANSLAAYNVFRGALDPVTLQPTGNAVVLASPSMALSVYRKADRSDSEVTWRINLDWDIDDSQMMYFSATTGYRGGGYNLVFFSTTQTYDPEELISYEIGYKGNMLDNTLQLNASMYLYDYETIHTFGTEASTIGGTTTSVLEAPGAEIYGFELEALWLATDRITLGANYSYTPSEYTDQLLISNAGDESCPFSLFNALLECTQGIEGNQVLNVAEHKGSAWASYNLPLGDSGAVNFNMAASWIDESFNTQFETDGDAAPPYERLDFRATWTSPSEQWVVTGFVKNVLDEVGVRQLEAQGNDNGFRKDGMVSEPRMYGIEVTYGLGAN